MQIKLRNANILQKKSDFEQRHAPISALCSLFRGQAGIILRVAVTKLVFSTVSVPRTRVINRGDGGSINDDDDDDDGKQLSDRGRWPVLGECGNEPSCSIKYGEFLD